MFFLHTFDQVWDLKTVCDTIVNEPELFAATMLQIGAVFIFGRSTLKAKSLTLNASLRNTGNPNNLEQLEIRELAFCVLRSAFCVYLG